jgi:hypothetical protein
VICSLKAARGVGHSVGRRQNATILESRLGADEENTGGDFAGDGETDHVVVGDGDLRDDGRQLAGPAGYA